MIFLFATQMTARSMTPFRRQPFSLDQRTSDAPFGKSPDCSANQAAPMNRFAVCVSRKLGTLLLAISAVSHAPFAAAASATSPSLDPHSGMVATCAECHGAAGEGSAAAGIPRLAGQNADYMAHALSMFKAGTRASPAMQAIARNLSDSDMRALSDYFAAQKPPLAAATQPPQQADVQRGQQLAQLGDGANVAACFSCHAAGGKGNGARFPSIAGQPATFTVARLHEFQERAKHGKPKPGSMTAVAAQMSDAQIEAAAAYLSTLSTN
jgi:cytochrome c553